MALDKLTTIQTSGIVATGIVTSNSYVGDGSGLTGVIGIGSGISIFDSDSPVGTAATVNFGDNLTVQFSAGISTIVGAAGTENVRTNSLDVIGVSTFRDHVLIGPNLSLSREGNVYTTGVATITQVTSENLNVSGIATVGFTTSSNAFYTGVVTATTFSGELSGNSTTATTASTSTNITVSDESTDTACNVVFVNDPTGAQLPKTGTNLTFNSNTGELAHTSAVISNHATVGSAVTMSESGINVSGIVTATQFKGDGSTLTGVVGSGSGVVVEHDGSTIGTAGTINFSANLDVSPISSGIVTVTAPDAINVGITTNLSGTFTATAGSPSTLNTYAYDSVELVFEYTVFVKNGSNYQSQKLLVMRDGTTVTSTQYAIMYSNDLLVQLDATINGSNLLLRATPETGVSGSTTYRVKREVA